MFSLIVNTPDGDVLVDFSKNRIDDEALTLLFKLVCFLILGFKPVVSRILSFYIFQSCIKLASLYYLIFFLLYRKSNTFINIKFILPPLVFFHFFNM